MSTYSRPRGTQDILPTQTPLWHHIEQTSRTYFTAYNYQELRTPIFESTDLFTRSMGAETEIVQKEMYSFTDKGDRSLTLRPEGTAPLIRACLQNNLISTPQKLFYQGPMFRYERPQAGRYRQFHHMGIENIGANQPQCDAEVIMLGYDLFAALHLTNYHVHLNTIGTKEERQHIETALRTYLATQTLPETYHRKAEKAPLLLLDSKNETIQDCLKGFPKLTTFLSKETLTHFEQVCTILTDHNIPYTITPNLVRGIDYYSHTVFEFISETLGAQNTVCAGGRYNTLIQTLGGKPTPAIGFAFGMERLVMLLEKTYIDHQSPLLYIAPLGTSQEKEMRNLTHQLRKRGLRCHQEYTSKELTLQLKKALQANATWMIIYGEDEKKNNVVCLKDLRNKTQETIPLADCINILTKLYTNTKAPHV